MRACLFGAAPDSGNLGVEALYSSVVAAMEDAQPDGLLSVFDNGWGVRSAPANRSSVTVEHCGVRMSRRLHRPESWSHIRMAARLGLPNHVASRVQRADVVLDVSGGDSFSDIYGHERLRVVLTPKRFAVSCGRPLVLLPQTYGPFSDSAAREAAREIIANATLAIARDADSYAALLELADSGVDGSRLRQGVDMAFALPAVHPQEMLPDRIRTALLNDAGRPRVGINISGLLYADPSAAARFGLRLNYREVVTRLTEHLLRNGSTVFLVPHVAPVSGGGAPMFDDDVQAIKDIAEKLADRFPQQLFAVPAMHRASHSKWVISTFDWFCGTRMHATIAGLSSAVPTAAVAYSMKTHGVFDTCGQAGHVVDARDTDSAEAVERLAESFEQRSSVRDDLSGRIVDVRTRARDQLVEIFNHVSDEHGS